MENTLFRDAIVELVVLGREKGYERLSFLYDFASRPLINFDIFIHNEYDEVDVTENPIPFPYIGLKFDHYRFYDLEKSITNLTKNCISDLNASPSYFKYYRRTLLWYSFIFDKNYKYIPKVFDPNTIKVGILSLETPSYHEIIKKIESFKLKVTYSDKRTDSV